MLLLFRCYSFLLETLPIRGSTQSFFHVSRWPIELHDYRSTTPRRSAARARYHSCAAHISTAIVGGSTPVSFIHPFFFFFLKRKTYRSENNRSSACLYMPRGHAATPSPCKAASQMASVRKNYVVEPWNVKSGCKPCIQTFIVWASNRSPDNALCMPHPVASGTNKSGEDYRIDRKCRWWDRDTSDQPLRRAVAALRGSARYGGPCAGLRCIPIDKTKCGTDHPSLDLFGLICFMHELKIWISVRHQTILLDPFFTSVLCQKWCFFGKSGCHSPWGEARGICRGPLTPVKFVNPQAICCYSSTKSILYNATDPNNPDDNLG